MIYRCYFLTEPEIKLARRFVDDETALRWFAAMWHAVRADHPHVCNGYLFKARGKLGKHVQQTKYEII